MPKSREKEANWGEREEGGIREREREREDIIFWVFGFPKPEYILLVIFQNEILFLRILNRIFDI